MEFFVKLVNGSHQLTTFTKSSILDVWVGSECAFAVISNKHQYQYEIEDFQLKNRKMKLKAGKTAQ